jgi:arylsulfatase A-like enzyme
VLQPEPQYVPLLKALLTGDRSRDTRAVFQLYFKNYLRLVATLDENVGRVLDFLDRSGLAENTIVFYTSDNGFLTGEHGLFNKMWMYEESLRLPLLARLPLRFKSTAGRVNSDLVSMLDLAPTLLDLAGAPIPTAMQGISFGEVLKGGTAVRPPRDLYYHYYGGPLRINYGNNRISNSEIVGVRTATEKLIYYPNWGGKEFWEYFDLNADPAEMHNRIGDPALQARIQSLRSKLQQLAAAYQDDEVVRRLSP